MDLPNYSLASSAVTVRKGFLAAYHSNSGQRKAHKSSKHEIVRTIVSVLIENQPPSFQVIVHMARKTRLAQRDTCTVRCAVPWLTPYLFTPLHAAPSCASTTILVILLPFSLELPPGGRLESRSRGTTGRESGRREGGVRGVTARREATREAWRRRCASVRVTPRACGVTVL